MSPVGLRGHFEDVASGYSWEPLPRTSDAFRVRITRSAYDPELARQNAAALAALELPPATTDFLPLLGAENGI